MSQENAQAAPAGFPQPRHIHDPSTIVRCAGEYWVFSTGQGVRTAHSTDLRTWNAGPPVFPQKPGWLGDIVPGHSGDLWAPDVIRVGRRWLLYYSVSAFGKNTSAIGLATATTLDPRDPAHGWRDEGIVVRSKETDDFNAIDPGVVLDSQGRLWLSFGSFWSGIKVVELDAATGKLPQRDAPMAGVANQPEIEAPCIVEHGGHFFLFVNWGACCRGVKSTYRIRVGRSQKAAGPYLDRDGVDLAQGGGSAFLDTEGARIGPGHAGILRDGSQTWLSYHFYDGDRQGTPRLAVRALEWDGKGWPVAGRVITPVAK